MKVAIPAHSGSLNSQVHPRFGRAPHFVVVDTDGGEITLHDNRRNASATHCVGLHVAGSLLELGIDAVITCDIGPEAFAQLQADNVKVHAVGSATVKEAVEQLVAGQLDLINEPTVKGHPPSEHG